MSEIGFDFPVWVDGKMIAHVKLEMWHVAAFGLSNGFHGNLEGRYRRGGENADDYARGARQWTRTLGAITAATISSTSSRTISTA
jgi:hypothetical protein